VRPFDGRRVLLVVSGGIAAYKSAFLSRRLIQAGASVDVILTEAAQRFVGAETFEAITGRQVHTKLWQTAMAHLDLGKSADVIVVAPATADLISSMAVGAAKDLASTTLLAAEAPVIVCPAMNTRMWNHPATQGNICSLIEFGYDIVGPAEGPLAEGESGVGRLIEPEEIMASIGRALESHSRFEGLKVVVTAGPTRSSLDPVRFLSNRSSGRMGYSLARASWRRGGSVTLITGPAMPTSTFGLSVIEVETAQEMQEALKAELAEADVLIMAAAVADFEVVHMPDAKIKKEGFEGLNLSLHPGPDLLLETKSLREKNGIFTLGFALETEDAIENGRNKMERKGMHLVAVNVANEPGAGFEVETNRISLLYPSGKVEELPLATKEELADQLLDHIESAMDE